MSIDGIRKRKPHTQRTSYPNNFSSDNSFTRKESFSHSQKTTAEKECPPNNLHKQDQDKAKKNHTRHQNNSLLKAFFKKTLFFVLLSLFAFFLLTAVYFVWKIAGTGAKISSSSPQKNLFLQTITTLTGKKQVDLKTDSDGRINVLLLGIAGKGKAGHNLTDTIMIAGIDTKNNKTALLSIPRDLYVSVPDTDLKMKINAVYEYGLSNNKGIIPLKKTIKEVIGLDIQYYLVVNFSGFEKFIDTIGGINIQVDRDIYDPRYPGPNYSYELFEIKKGFHKMDGATALKYARERHNDPEGDFGRAKRQQKVLQAVKNKIFSTRILFNPFKLNAILNTLGDNVKTNASFDEIKSFLTLLKQVDTQNINNVVVDAWKKDSVLKVSHIFVKDIRMFILVPRVGNYSEIHEIAKNIFNLNTIHQRQEKIAEENPKIAIINKGMDGKLTAKIKKMLTDKLKPSKIAVLKSANKIYSEQTKVIDLTDKQKPFTLDELTKKLSATLSSEKSPIDNLKENDFTDYDFIVILGNDLIESYQYDEDSIEDLNNQNI